jgi:hypothetical protein
VKRIALFLNLLLLAGGCSQKPQVAADGTPQFVLTAGAVASPIYAVTNGVFIMSSMGIGNPYGLPPVTVTTNQVAGMTGIRFKLTAATVKELRKFLQYMHNRTIEGPGRARAQVLVGSKVVYEGADFTITATVWIAGGEVALSFHSPEEAQSVVAALTNR